MTVSGASKTPLALTGIIVVAAVLGILASVSSPAATVLLAALSGLLVMLLASAHPYWVVLSLVAFMPFESLMLKLLPLSDQMYFASQFISELLIYLTFAVLVLQKILKGASLRKTPIDGPLLAFVAVAILSIAVNGVPVLGSLLSLRPLLRYMVLFLLVVNLNLAPKQVVRLVRIILFVGLLQMLIAVLQLASGGALDEFLLPRQTDIGVAGQSRGFVLVTRGRELGSVFGTLGDTVYFGLFMLIVLAVYLGRLQKLRAHNAFFLVGILVAVGYSYARATVFGALLMLLVFYRVRYGLIRTSILLFLMLSAGVVGVFILVNWPIQSKEFVPPLKSQQSILDNVTGVFSSQYVARAQKQRLGALIGVAPTVLVNRPVLGYGPDQETTIERLNKSRPSFLLKPIGKKGFEDVYWVALLAYSGLAGVFALMVLLYKLYSSAWKIYRTAIDSLARGIALSVICMTVLSPFLLFFNQVLKFRVYGFYFWLLPALMFGSYAKERTLICRSRQSQ